MRAVALALAGRCDEARQHVGRVDPVARREAPWALHHLALLGQGQVWLEQYREARPVLGSVLDTALRADVPSVLAPAYTARCELEWWTGHWSSAAEDGHAALRWAEELRHTASVAHALAALGRLDAARGDVVACRRRMHQLRREAGQCGTDCFAVHIPSVLGLSALGAGDHRVAAQHLEQAWQAARDSNLGGTDVVPFSGDLAEALIRAAEPVRAREALEWLNERAVATGLGYPMAAAARCHGLLAVDLDTAVEAFGRASALYRRCPMPFERARTLLCEGETLRRLRRPSAARQPLREALTCFEALGARSWTARAEVELAATGDRAAAGKDRPGGLTLTPQESQIACSVARGRKNAEVAAALFVSRKTVEAHLTSIYRKLGVRSRTELVRLLAQSGTD